MLKAKVVETIEKHKMFSYHDRVLVGVSGGPDSVALLHVLRELGRKYNLDLHVAHLNHGLRGKQAETDQKFVRELSKKFSLPGCTLMAQANIIAIAINETPATIGVVMVSTKLNNHTNTAKIPVAKKAFSTTFFQSNPKYVVFISFDLL